MILFYILVFFSAVPNHPLVEQPIGGLTVIKYLGIFCVLYAITRIVAAGEFPRFFKTWQSRCFGILFAVAMLSFLLKPNVTAQAARTMVFSYVSFALAFLVTIALVDSVTKYRITLLCAIGAIAFASLYVLREWQKSGFEETRPGYVAGDANYFSLCALLVLPLMVYFVSIPGPRWQKCVCYLALGFTLPAFTVASSRGGFLGLAGSFAYAIVRSPKWKQHLLVGLVFIVPLMFIAPSSPVKRFLHPGTGEIQAVEIRKEFWEVGWKMIKENPLTGIGLGQFALALDDYGGQDLEARGIACNTYLEYWAELGIFALLAYIGALWFSLRTAEAQRKYARALKDPFLYFSALGLQAGVIGYSIAGIFVSAEYQKLFWFVIALTCCIPRFLKHSIRERPSAQELSFQDSFDVSLDNQQIVHR